MYDRKVNDQVLTFSVSGKLWQRSLVMYDHETQGLWAHLYGRCMEGPLKGKTLRPIPSALTTWADWREDYPQTTVLALAPVSPNIEYNLSKYSSPADFVLGVSGNDHKRAWTFPQLVANPLIHDKLGNDPIVVFFDTTTYGAAIYDRRLDGRELNFISSNDRILDEGSNSVWDLSQGVSTEGPLAGAQLKRIPAVISYIQAWNTFHPETEYWNSPSGKR